MLYDVPQTDATTEPAMAAFVARLRASAPKPEAIPAGAQVDAQLAIHGAEAIDLVVSALGDRATPPIVRWDAALDGCARKLAARAWYDTRGRQRGASGDDGITAAGQAADAYLARLRPGDGDAKSENPVYVDSASTARDAPWISSSATADGWVERVRRYAGRP